MEALEEVVGVPSKDLFHIVKGKRTKRLRLQSPIIPFSLVTTRSSSHDSLNACNNHNNNIESGSIGNGEGIACNNNNNNNNNNEILSSAEAFINTFTKEEEETAECLVLLSKIHNDHHPHPRPRNKFIMEDNNMDDLRPSYKTKFNSKRYVETSTNTVDGTKAGMYVYECKTCNRTFPSFQALGGHRASHKKPKTSLNAEFNRKSYLDFSDEDDYHQQHSPSTTTFYNYKNKNNYIKQNMPNSSSPARIHECSYCGAEFTSGQALGGHMRRHRGGANVNSPLHLNNLSPATSIDQEFGNNNNNIIVKKQRDHDELSLDLNNLPVQDDPVVSLKKQDQGQTQRQLVDCHY